MQSNRIPIEITRGRNNHESGVVEANANGNAAPTATTAANTLIQASSFATASQPYLEPPPKKSRSSIFISTASDLDQIVTHSNNLWAKYNAIAKEHNQRVNWVVVAKELGIHVKVREKYARMHSRALSRGFDFVNWGHYRVKDYPQYFMDPLGPEEEAVLRANAVGAPGVLNGNHSNFDDGQVHQGQGRGQQENLYQGNDTATGMNHDAITLAASVAAGSPMGGNAYDGSGMEGLPPLVHGLASEMPQQVHETPMMGADLVRALNMSRASSSSVASSPDHASGSSNGSFSVNV